MDVAASGSAERNEGAQIGGDPDALVAGEAGRLGVAVCVGFCVYQAAIAEKIGRAHACMSRIALIHVNAKAAAKGQKTSTIF